MPIQRARCWHASADLGQSLKKNASYVDAPPAKNAPKLPLEEPVVAAEDQGMLPTGPSPATHAAAIALTQESDTPPEKAA